MRYCTLLGIQDSDPGLGASCESSALVIAKRRTIGGNAVDQAADPEEEDGHGYSNKRLSWQRPGKVIAGSRATLRCAPLIAPPQLDHAISRELGPPCSPEHFP